MAKQQSELDLEIREKTKGWVVVNRLEEPLQWAAWNKWRRENCGSQVEFENLTVPTQLPPITIAAAKDYIATVQMMRAQIGWRGTRGKISKDPSAWMGA